MLPKGKSVGLVLLSLFLIISFVALGAWQISRGFEKKEMMDKFAASAQQPTIAVKLPLQALEQWKYKQVTLVGHYVSETQFLLDNQVRDGQAGYNVLTAFVDENSGQTILVDRGWVKAPVLRSDLPDVSVSENLDKIWGYIYEPAGKPYSLGGLAEGEHDVWPRRIQYVDFDQLSKIGAIKIQPFILRLAPAAPSGYRRDWTLDVFPPEKHFAYAFQWFAIAITVGVLITMYLKRPMD